MECIWLDYNVVVPAPYDYTPLLFSSTSYVTT